MSLSSPIDDSDRQSGVGYNNNNNNNRTTYRGSSAATQQQQQQQQQPMTSSSPSSSYFDPTNNNTNSINDFPGATYEETYGDAYTGGRMVYIYPSGYQSMRPRSCPWKLSIIVCLLFTWLSVFIVGHCADQFDYEAFIENIKNNAANNNTSFGSGYKVDEEAIETRWCGSRPLYLMWVVSMMITALSASYCGIIGYIKVRDFAVANSRSQPAGILEGKSDYYLRIQDDGTKTTTTSTMAPAYKLQPTYSTPDSMTSSSYHHTNQHHTTIYQSDGTPQFWGTYIFKPTQAAVAVSNR